MDTRSPNDAARRPRLSAWVWGGRGSALIVALLVILALTAMGLVGLRNVTKELRAAGNHRLRKQASTAAESVATFAAARAGDNAENYWELMQHEQDQHKALLDELGLPTYKDELAVRGPVFIRSQVPGASDQDETFYSDSLNLGSETGLFRPTGAPASFETKEQASNFDVVIRDTLDAIPAPLYGDDFCYRKVTVTGQTNLGNLDASNDDWNGAAAVARRRASVEALIGPVECEVGR